jgi:hypothetical protein
MSLPQHITYQEGGTVAIDLLSLPSNVVVDIFTGDNTQLVTSGTANISAISTVLSAAASRGATIISLANTSGIVCSSVIWLQDDPEPVLVRKMDTTTNVAYLRRPLLKDHANNAVAQGARCTFAVNSAVANTLFFEGRIKWTVDGKIDWSALECTKYPLKRHATIQDVFDRQPKMYDLLDPEADAERLLDLAHDEVLQRIGAAGRARVFTGSTEFKNATVLCFLMLFYERMSSQEGTALFERYKELFEQDLERTMQTQPRDLNQNDEVHPAEQMPSASIVIRRA